jgi:vancomycin resistance protein YoaR
VPRLARVRHHLDSLPRALVIAVAALVFVVGVFVADGLANAGEIRQGVRVAGIDLSGMTPDKARARLAAAARALDRGPVRLQVGHKSTRVERARLGVRVDVDATVAAALAFGRRGPLDLSRFRSLAGGIDLGWRTGVDRPVFQALLASLRRHVARPPQEPAVRVVGGEPMLVAGAPGQVIDVEAAKQALAVVVTRGGSSAVLDVVDGHPTVSEAAARAALARVERLLAGPIEVSDRAERATLAPGDLAPAVRAVPASGQLAVRLHRKELDAALRRRAPFAYEQARDATFKVTGRRVAVVPAVPGRKVDPARAGLAVLAAGEAAGGARRVALPVTLSPPGLTTAEAQKLGVRERVATFTTQFDASDAPRVHNIALIGEAVDDRLVRPGETFSMNAATGERTAAKGYRTAHVIVNGEVVDGLGGGVCQAGTTFFNAIFFGGYDVVQRTNHSLHLSRYPLGRDATLNWPDKDVKFRNDTPYTVLIRARVTPSSMTVSLYSTDVGNEIAYTTSGRSNFRSPPTRYEDDPTLPAGTEQVEESGSSGFDVTVRRVVRRGGRVVHNDTFTSNYVAWTRVVRRGTKPKPADPPAAPAPAPPRPTVTTVAALPPPDSGGA